MADKHKILKNIHGKVDDLIKKSHQVRQNNVNLMAENKELEESLNKKTQLLNKIEEELKALKIAKNMGSEVDSDVKRDMKKQIDHYIKEIDGCLTILNQ